MNYELLDPNILMHITAGTRGALEQKSVRRYSGNLPNLKHASNLPPAKSHVSVTTGQVVHY